MVKKPYLLDQAPLNLDIPDEDSLRSILFEKVSDLRSLVTSASELALLSGNSHSTPKDRDF